VARYLARRLGWSLAALVVFASAAFFLVAALPFDYASAAGFGCPGCAGELRGSLGLDRPLVVQYAEFMRRLASGSLGESFSGQPVLDILTGQPMWTTVFIFGLGAVLAFVLGAWLGRIAAWKAGRAGAGLLNVLAITTYTLFPPFLVFVLLLYLNDPLRHLRDWLGLPRDEGAIFASSGWDEVATIKLVGMSLLVAAVAAVLVRRYLRARRAPRWLTALVFPVALVLTGVVWWALGAWEPAMNLLLHAPRFHGSGFGGLNRGFQGAAGQGGGNALLAIVGVIILSFGEILLVVEASMASETDEQYVLTARAKGVPDDVVRDRHAARNALLPALTRFVIGLPLLLTGLIIVERELELRGLSTLFLDAAQGADVPVVLGALVLFGGIVLLARLALEVLIAALDPRVRAQVAS
jgi:peptide/nickel transport system permease protein